MSNQNELADVDLGYAQLTSIDAATFISTATFGGSGVPGIPAGTKRILIQPQTQAVRIRSDGVAPTAAVGYPIAVGSEMRYNTGNFGALRIISQTAGAVVNLWALG